MVYFIRKSYIAQRNILVYKDIAASCKFEKYLTTNEQNFRKIMRLIDELRVVTRV